MAATATLVHRLREPAIDKFSFYYPLTQPQPWKIRADVNLDMRGPRVRT